MSDQPQEPSAGEEPTLDDMEAVEWAREVGRKELQLLQDGLRQLVTLTTALLGGSAALLGQAALPRWCKTLGAVCLLLALASSLVGSLPYRTRFDPRNPDGVRAARLRGVRYKTWLLWTSATALFLALVWFVIGAVLADPS
jgi:hypothetical protein